MHKRLYDITRFIGIVDQDNYVIIHCSVLTGVVSLVDINLDMGTSEDGYVTSGPELSDDDEEFEIEVILKKRTFRFVVS